MKIKSESIKPREYHKRINVYNYGHSNFSESILVRNIPSGNNAISTNHRKKLAGIWKIKHLKNS